MVNALVTAKANSDFAELTFLLKQAITSETIAPYQYSGITWGLNGDEPISLGT